MNRREAPSKCRVGVCAVAAILAACSAAAAVGPSDAGPEWARSPGRTYVGDPTLVSVDEAAPESDVNHNSDPAADLTRMYAWIEGAALDTLVVAVDFSSVWQGMHLMVILEKSRDAAGATADPFGFHVDYTHALRPDFVFTYKYSAEDYADLRRWNERWEFWQLVSRTWTTDENDPGKNALPMVRRSGARVLFRFPVAAIGVLAPGDTLGLEAYVGQESQGSKYNALDSSPQDATHDMLPPSGNWWETATTTVNLATYASLGLPAFGVPPVMTDAAAAPDTVAPGEDVLLSVRVTNAGGGIGLVQGDFSELGGDSAAALNDAGTGGDQQAGDGVYSLRLSMPDSIGGGAYTVGLTARDSTNIAFVSASAVVVVRTELLLVLSEKDPPGDDHGPSLMDSRGNPVAGLYYFYPTDAVFKQGAFDLRRADFMTDGQFLVIRVFLGNVLSNQEVKWNAPYPGPSCASANKAELNLQKIDIYIDSREDEGATAGFPDRYVDIARVDAWEYGIAVEGWWVGLVRSNGSNSTSQWTYLKRPQDIYICNDHVEDYVDIRIALEALGNPTGEELKTWDFIITAAGHDGNSSDQNLGATRPVNASVSQWQFGGGKNSEGGNRNRDANIIDVLPISGRGKALGRSQAEMLDYTTPEATARFDGGKVACLIEASGEASCSIWGRVNLSDTLDASSIVTVDAYEQGDLISSTRTRPGGGYYCLGVLPNGTYNLEARAPSYGRTRIEGIVVQGGNPVGDVDFALTKVYGVIAGRVNLLGPERDVRVYALDVATGDLSGEGVKVRTGSGSFEILGVENGSHTLVAQARGYASFDSLVTVSGGETVNATINLDVARATKYVFINSVVDVAYASAVGVGANLGNEICSREISQSLPQKGFFDYAHLVVEPRNAKEDAAVFDAYATDSVALGVSLLNPAAPFRGMVVIADSLGQETPGALLRSSAFREGVGHFYVRDDSVEVLRIVASRGPSEGAVEVGVRELKPARIRLMPDRDSIVVGGAEVIKVGVQLLDKGGNRVPFPNKMVQMQTIQGSPIFGPEVEKTDPNGYFETRVYGYRSGVVMFTAKADTLPCDTLTVFFKPGPADHISAGLSPPVFRKGAEGLTTFQVADRFDNPVPEAGVRIDVTASPAGRLDSLETPLFTDGAGKAQGVVRAGDTYGVVNLTAAAIYATGAVKLWIGPRLVAVDEASPESDAEHNSNSNVDLTTMFAWLKDDTLKVALDFSSTWEGAHLMVALENRGDAAGGTRDPFLFPVVFEHSLKPDFVFTYKYTAADYADLRRWGGTGWEFWNLPAAAWITKEDDPNKDAKSMVSKGENQVVFAFPTDAVGAVEPGDTLRLEAYVTQEGAGGKYTALDSAPHDVTHDMEPDSGYWHQTAASDTVHLGHYAVVPILGRAPVLSNPEVSPSPVSPGDTVVASLHVADQGGGIGDVLADLSSIGGDNATRLNDDGQDGDGEAGDGTYSVGFTIPDGVSQGGQKIGFTGWDSLNVSQASATSSIEIVNPPTLIKVVEDSLGDDHGPSLRKPDGAPGDSLFYVYPTNGVFDQGVYDPERHYNVGGTFDIERAEFLIDGRFLVIRVYVGNIPPSEAVGWNATYPGAGCTDPSKADLNLHKMDVYIDSREGAGATAGLPDRFADVVRNDAWEYAVAVEGWWKGLVTSNGQNSISLWTTRHLDEDISVCDNHVEDYIDVKIALSVLGDPAPSAEDILKWDFIITVGSHEGDSNDSNFGATRKVNRGTSEWQFGGGLDDEGNRSRDPNIIDVLAVPGIVPGSDKQPGRSQLDMLNYLADDAKRRFKAGSTACRLEATYSEDISPPEIKPFSTGRFAHHVWHTLEYAPISFWAVITDSSDVDYAAFEWRPVGESAWRVADMASITKNYWIVDFDTTQFEQDVRLLPIVDGSQGRGIEVKIRARDQYGNEALSSLITPVVPEQKLASDVVRGLAGDATWVFYDGTVMGLGSSDSGYSTYDVRITPADPTDYRVTDRSLMRSSMDYTGVARQVEVFGYKGGFAESLATFPGTMLFALHYPSYSDPQIGDEKKLGLFRFNDVTQRWIGVYGGVNERGNAVTAEVEETGLYALFRDSNLSYDRSKGLSGVTAEPNPFSPNGDGLYEDTRISFFSSRDADWVTMELYDIAGEPVRTLCWQKGLTATGRNTFDMVWDGASDDGEIVPYGIYVLRVEVRFKTEPRYERQNIPIVVLK